MFFKDIWKIARPFFTGEKKYYAIAMLCGIFALELGFIYLLVVLNYWYNDFYNALQDYNYPAFIFNIKKWLWLVGLLIVTFMSKFFLNLWLGLQWRIWMTHVYVQRWMDHNSFYGIKVLGDETDNPDQRISQDIDSFISSFLSLSIGLLSNIITIISFIGILWELSGELNFFIGDNHVTVHGYMVWIALLYTAISTYITHKIGNPLSSLLFHQERVEADFRYALVRLRENAESIAFFRAASFEVRKFYDMFIPIIQNMIAIIKRRMGLSTFMNFYSNFANILPVILVAPRYFRHEIKFGGVMQTATAFGKVQDAMSWVINAYVEIANFRAVTNRLTGFINAIESWEKACDIQHNLTIDLDQEKIGWDDLEVRLPDGSLLFNSQHVRLKPGVSYIIEGASGIGKSTLLRTLAGIWPFATGTLSLPKYMHIAYVPQKAYMPLGDLYEVLQYPVLEHPEHELVVELLQAFCLEGLIPRLNEVQEWSRTLSGGEQQKISFIRLVLSKPNVIFLDEATNALDSDNAQNAYRQLRKYLPDAILVSVSHGKGVKALHDEVLTLVASEGGAAVLQLA